MKYCFSIVLLLSALHSYADNNETTPIDSVAFSRKLDEVVVVAEKREVNSLNLPGAVSVVKESDIPLEGNIDIRNLSGLIPNFYMLDYGMKLSSPVFIRGIGTKSGTPAVGLYVDGVAIFDKNAYVFDLSDIKQIEVLRGPQGTLQGRNTLGGMINILTNPPSSKFSVWAKAGYGNYNTQDYHALVNIPFTRNFFNKFAFAYHKSDGFFTNKYNNTPVDKAKNYNVKYQGRWTPGTDWDIKFGANYDRTDDGGYAYHILDSLKKDHYGVSYDTTSSYKRDLITSYLNLKKEFEMASVNWVTSYSYCKDHQKVDQDFSDIKLYFNEKPSSQNLVTQEINVQSRQTKHLDWIVGTFGFFKELTNDVTTNYLEFKQFIPPFKNSLRDVSHNNTVNKGIAGYGQLTVKEWLPGLFITGGIRYDYERADLKYQEIKSFVKGPNAIGTPVDTDKVFKEWLPKFSILQRWNNQSSTYVTASKGYKAGGFNIVADEENNNKLDYDNEYTWNYEIGYKYFSRNRKLRLNAAVFYIDWKDQQVFEMQTNAAVIKNAGDAFSTGAEVDLQWQFLQDFTYNLALGYTHAEYTDYKTKKTDKGQPVIIDYRGNNLPMVPEYTFNTGVRYSRNINASFVRNITVATDVTGFGEQYFDETNTDDLAENAYFLWNASCIVTFNHLSLELWAKNMLDKHYFAYKFASPMGMNCAQSGTPATFGASLSVNF